MREVETLYHMGVRSVLLFIKCKDELKDNAGTEYRYVRDKVVGGTKETVGKLTDNEVLQLRGALQKRHISDEVIRNVLIGVGTMAGLYLVKKIIHKISE